MYLLQPSPPLINPYLSVFPTYQCNTQQVVVKTVISSGQFHVSEKKLHLTKAEMGSEMHFGWLIGFELTGPLRLYFSLYWAISQTEGKNDRQRKKVQTPPAPTTSTVGPCPVTHKNSRTPRYWMFIQHHRTTRLPRLRCKAS